MSLEYIETAKFILEVVKVMIPVLTGFLAVSASGIGKLWGQKHSVTNMDITAVSTIAFMGIFSFAAWATALAGAMIYTTNEPSSLAFLGKMTAIEALTSARIAVGWGYNSLVGTIFCSGFYYLFLLSQKNSISGSN